MAFTGAYLGEDGPVTDAGYVLGGYTLTAVVLGGYVVRLRARVRSLSSLPEDHQPAVDDTPTKRR